MPRAMHSSHSRRLAALAVALLAAIVLAACGGSSGSSSSNSVKKTASTRATGATGPTGAFGGGGYRRGTPYGGRRAFRGGAPSSSVTACLRKHGVTVPQGAGGAGGAGPPSGAGAPNGSGAPGGSSFAAAMRACGINFGGRTYTPASAARRAAINRFAACMASNGDKLPTPNYSGNGAIFPASVEKGAKFKTAYAKCRSLVAATTA